MRRRTALLIAVTVFCLAPLYGQERPRVGLVLSGGGARGFAHIGILKMLDSLDIPVDYIAGTSMGGIMGALYAIGYSGKEIEADIRDADWVEIFSDKPRRSAQPFFQKKECGRYQLELGIVNFFPVLPAGIIIGQKIYLLFSKLIFPFNEIRDYDRLPTPYRCVAVNLMSGKEYIIGKGPLDKAMRTTMAIPSVFSPVSWGDSLYVDGGISNNLPVDVVKQMGADLVIAVDVMGPQKKPQTARSILDVFERTISILGMDKWQRNVQSADLYIQPDLDEFTMMDFSKEKIDAIITRGDSAASLFKHHLLSLRDSENLRCFHDVSDLVDRTAPLLVRDIQISGPTSIQYARILEMLSVSEGDVFAPDEFHDCISRIRKAGLFRDITYEIIPLTDREIRLAVRVWQLSEPRISNISIGGNVNHSDGFIYRLIGLKAGDRLLTEDLHQRIMNLYSYGYFEKITYELVPTGDNSVHLMIYVSEKPQRLLRIGLRFDNYYKFTGIISGQATDLPLTGMRIVNELQFAGLWRYHAKIYYPSRTLNMSVYPYLEANYHDVPLTLYTAAGEAAANYKDRSTRASAGLGIFISNIAHGDISYQYEKIHTAPTISSLDPDLFPGFSTSLRQLLLRLDIDSLDDIYVPSRGFQIHSEFETGYRQSGSNRFYERFFIYGDFYRTAGARHTGRLYMFTSRSSARLPLYKYINQGGPDTFVGMPHDQLFARQLNLARIEYRLKIHPYLSVRLIGNTAFGVEHTGTGETGDYSFASGAGLGITFAYPVGSLELTVARGHRGFSAQRDFRTTAYISMGAKF